MSHHRSPSYADRETPTASGFGSRPRMPVQPVSEPPAAPLTVEEQIGQLMAATARLERAVNAQSTELGTLSREVSQLGKTQSEERPALAKASATKTANRMAALLGTLGVLCEIAWPMIRELVRGMGH